jgi:type I restriction enzyme S subunit
MVDFPEVGIRSFGKGTFHKPVLSRAQLANKRVFRVQSGDLVFMNVFAWEGAIAVAKPKDEDRVASHRFMTHVVDQKQATPEFLCHHFLTEHGLEQIRGASPGSAGRNRTLGITKLHAIKVPVPPMREQKRFSAMVKKLDELRSLQKEAEFELAAFTPALLAKAFRGEL